MLPDLDLPCVIVFSQIVLENARFLPGDSWSYFRCSTLSCERGEQNSR
jgi:hypothetical protein